MKRSKMLDILQTFFQSDCAFEDPHDALISAERILKIVEECGMRPPPVYMIDINPEWFGGEITKEGWEDEK